MRCILGGIGGFDLLIHSATVSSRIGLRLLNAWKNLPNLLSREASGTKNMHMHQRQRSLIPLSTH